MSLILDALNRAERERNKTRTVPNLQTVHDSAPLAATPSHSNHYFLIIATLVFLALLITVYVGITAYNRSSIDAEKNVLPSVVMAEVTQEKVLAENIQPEKSISLSTSDISHSTSSHSVGSVGSSTPAHRSASSVAAANIPVPAADLAELYASAQENEIKASEAPRAVEELYVAPPPKSETLKSEIAIVAAQEPPVPEQIEIVETDISTAIRSYDSLVDLPDIGDLPSGLRTQIATINYLRHNFDANGGGTVVINGKAHRTGATVVPNLMLEEIVIDGIILRYKQTRFKLRALNSWINM
jgi:general secretion pathway protein B